MTLPSSTMLCSISESRTDTSFMIDVNGPTYAWHDPARAPMITGPRTIERSTTAPASMTTLPSTRDSGVHRPVDPALERVEDQPVGLEHVLELARVLPPAVHDVGPDHEAAIDQVLDGVGDLQLVPRARRDPRDRLEDLRAEHVDAHQGEVAPRLLRLLHEAHDFAVAQLGDAEHLRVGHAREQDLRGRPRRRELLDEAARFPC